MSRLGVPVGGAKLDGPVPLPPATVLTARCGAIAGAHFDAGLVAEVAEMDRPEVDRAIDELVERDIVRLEDGSPPMFTFSDDQLRLAVYRGSPPAWRVSTHARMAAILAKRGAPLPARAYHVEWSAQPGDIEAAKTLAEAATACMSHDPATAVRWLRGALRLLPELPTTRALYDQLTWELVKAFVVQGDYCGGRDLLRQLLMRPSGGSPLDRRSVLAYYARMQRLLGRAAEAYSLLRVELDAEPAAGSPATAELMVELSVCALLCRKYSVGVDAARDALVAAERAGARPVVAAARAALALGLCLAGDFREANKHVDTSLLMVEALPDAGLSAGCEWPMWALAAALQLEQLDRAQRVAERLLRTVAFTETHLRAELAFLRAEALARLGRVRDVRESILGPSDVVSLVEEHAGLHAVADWARGQVEPKAWEPAGVEAQAPFSFHAVSVARYIGETKLLSGDAAGCLAIVDRLGGPDLPRAEPASRAALCELFTRAALNLGRMSEAARWSEQAVTAANATGLSGANGLAALAAAHAVRVTAPARAVESAERAIELLDTAEMSLDAGRARLALGRALAAAGDRDRATSHILRARAGFEKQGALRLAQDATRERRVVAARSPRDRKGYIGIGGLTLRERQVAALIAEGLTNRAAAGRLYITEKTIEAHLARIFMKLGTNTRAAVAAAVVRANGLRPPQAP